MNNNNNNQFTSWEPRPNWLLLLPSRIPPYSGEIVLPDSYTKKACSGICIKAGSDIDIELFLNHECFFALHTEYGIQDTDTGWTFYVLPTDKVLLTRTPPPEILQFSREKPKDSFSPFTIEHSQKP